MKRSTKIVTILTIIIICINYILPSTVFGYGNVEIIVENGIGQIKVDGNRVLVEITYESQWYTTGGYIQLAKKYCEEFMVKRLIWRYHNDGMNAYDIASRFNNDVDLIYADMGMTYNGEIIFFEYDEEIYSYLESFDAVLAAFLLISENAIPSDERTNFAGCIYDYIDGELNVNEEYVSRVLAEEEPEGQEEATEIVTHYTINTIELWQRAFDHWFARKIEEENLDTNEKKLNFLMPLAEQGTGIISYLHNDIPYDDTSPGSTPILDAAGYAAAYIQALISDLQGEGERVERIITETEETTPPGTQETEVISTSKATAIARLEAELGHIARNQRTIYDNEGLDEDTKNIRLQTYFQNLISDYRNNSDTELNTKIREIADAIVPEDDKTDFLEEVPDYINRYIVNNLGRNNYNCRYSF